ncbi:MAG TPA: ATP-binding protein [Ignavibacteriaceae bacterium]|nr:ATP-binding protein [Ignavibacteriaceae bacterium]
MKFLIPKKKPSTNLILNGTDVNTLRQDTAGLIVKSRTDNLSRIRKYILDVTGKYGIEQDITDKIILAVDEACTNIIKHAYQSKPDNDIIINAFFKNGKFIINITDFGKGFNPELIPDPDMPSYLKQRRVGGLGMHLMRTLMDKVEYHSQKDKYNKLVLEKNIN